jgi:hypothetical protein
MNTVKFTGWQEGIKKITLTHLLNEKAGLSLTQAKLNVDAIIDGVTVEILCPTAKATKELFNKASQLGAICEISSSKK